MSVGMNRAYVILALSAAACGSSDGSELASLKVALSASSVQVGKTVTATATGYDDSGAVVALSKLAWSTSAASLAPVDAQGLVTAVGAGAVEIRAASDGVVASAALTVEPDPVAACRLPGGQYGVSLGFPRIANRLRSTGAVHIKVLFVDFSDAVATRTTQATLALFSPGAEQFYSDVSYGRMQLTLEPVHGWLRMSKPTSGYPWNPLTFAGQKAFIAEAVALAGASLDASSADSLVVISNPDATALGYGPAFTANAGDGFQVGAKTFDNGATSGHDLLTWGPGWFNHEFGHAMGLVDLYEIGMPNPQAFHYAGAFSTMSYILGDAREYLGWERWLLGWIDDADVVCAPRGQTSATLVPIETAGGTKMIVAPTGATTAVVVESRRSIGHDTDLVFEGPLVYFIDTSLATGAGVVKVLPIDDTDLNKTSNLLQPAQSLTYAGVTVTLSATDAAGDHVAVSY